MHSRRSLARQTFATENHTKLEVLPPTFAEHSLGYQIRYAYRLFVKVLDDELGAHQITTGQWSALRVLWRADGISQVELADRMMVEKASLTALIKSLAKQGLITRARNTEDRRMFNITVTAAGRRLESRLLPLVSKINRRATQHLSAAEVDKLHHLLAKVMINLQNLSDED
jgi:DNA-binding MarR family transcriptional regulator